MVLQSWKWTLDIHTRRREQNYLVFVLLKGRSDTFLDSQTECCQWLINETENGIVCRCNSLWGIKFVILVFGSDIKKLHTRQNNSFQSESLQNTRLSSRAYKIDLESMNYFLASNVRCFTVRLYHTESQSANQLKTH